jgi:hypothetical protein
MAPIGKLLVAHGLTGENSQEKITDIPARRESLSFSTLATKSQISQHKIVQFYL